MESIKIRELRIGNYVDYGIGNPDVVANIYSPMGGYIGFTWQDLEGDRNIELSEVKPISLTEQWLKDFGFEGFIGGTKGVTVLGIASNQIIRFSIERWESNGKYYPPVGTNEIEYVHQLQNLYFALTGKELIKE